MCSESGLIPGCCSTLEHLARLVGPNPAIPRVSSLLEPTQMKYPFLSAAVTVSVVRRGSHIRYPLAGLYEPVSTASVDGGYGRQQLFPMKHTFGFLEKLFSDWLPRVIVSISFHPQNIFHPLPDLFSFPVALFISLTEIGSPSGMPGESFPRTFHLIHFFSRGLVAHFLAVVGFTYYC